jgi:hypothetical protein
MVNNCLFGALRTIPFSNTMPNDHADSGILTVCETRYRFLETEE